MSDPKAEFKKTGKVMFGTWVLLTLAVLFWPYHLIEWFTPEQTIDWWGYASLASWGFLGGWFYAHVVFVWKSKE